MLLERVVEGAVEGEEVGEAVRGHVMRPASPDTDSGFGSQHGGLRTGLRG